MRNNEERYIQHLHVQLMHLDDSSNHLVPAFHEYLGQDTFNTHPISSSLPNISLPLLLISTSHISLKSLNPSGHLDPSYDVPLHLQCIPIMPVISLDPIIHIPA